MWEAKHKTYNPCSVIWPSVLLPDPQTGHPPYLSGISAHKMSEQLIALAVISGLLWHEGKIPICHTGGQEVWHVVKCLMVKTLWKRSRSRSENSSQKTQRMPLKTKPTNQQEKTWHNAIKHLEAENYGSKNASCWSFLLVRWKLVPFCIQKENRKNNRGNVQYLKLNFMWLRDRESIDNSAFS